VESAARGESLGGLGLSHFPEGRAVRRCGSEPDAAGDEEELTLAKHLPPPPRKQRTREHVLADLSVNHVERFALRCGFAVQRLSEDYGLDLAVFTFEELGFREEGLLWMQLKATDHMKTSHDGKSALVRVERRDILSWIRELYPVILVVYDAVRDLAYYLVIPDYFAGPEVFAKLKGATVTMQVPTENVVNEKALRGLARLK
jgi:hypothetical protein